jgi:soluble lytic murein transglycosylase-like protein
MGRLVTSLVFVSAFLVASTGAVADNIYACINSDGDEVLTNIRKNSKCRLVMKGMTPSRGGSRSPAKSARARPEGEVKKDWSEYDAFIKEAAETYNIPIPLLKAVIKAESALDPYAVSCAGAEGLMQLMPGTATDMNVSDTFNPRENIMGGAKYLRMLANMFDGDMVLMLAGYNAGHNRVIKDGNTVPKIDETRVYIRRVYENYVKFKKEYEEEQKTRSGSAPGGRAAGPAATSG